jgi:hypothetical protein
VATNEAQQDADIRAADAPPMVKIAGAAQILTGVLVTLTGLQQVFFSVLYWGDLDWMQGVQYVQIALGLVPFVIGIFVLRARPWGAFAARSPRRSSRSRWRYGSSTASCTGCSRAPGPSWFRSLC